MKPASEWEKRLEMHRIPYGFVNTYLEAICDPQVAHRGLIKNITHPVSGDIRVVGAPWKMSDFENHPSPPPLLGEHTSEVLREWLCWPETKAVEFTEVQLALRGQKN